MRVSFNYISNALGRAIDVQLVIPSPVYADTLPFQPAKPVYVPKAKYPVIYLLHGVGNDGHSWLSYTQAELFAEENNIAVVTFGAENKFDVNTGADRFEQLIEEELPEVLCGYFPISSRKEDTFLCGLSMGGYGALLNYLKKPARYGGVGVLSGAVDKYDYANTEEGKAYNIYHLIARQKEDEVPFAPLYVACGEDDFIRDNSLNLKKALEEAEIPFTWVSTPGYGHEWRFWNEQLEKFILWLPRTDAYAGQTRKV